jgi:hypothetical protein
MALPNATSYPKLGDLYIYSGNNNNEPQYLEPRFEYLSDVPHSFQGKANDFVCVNNSEDGLTFYNAGPAGTVENANNLLIRDNETATGHLVWAETPISGDAYREINASSVGPTYDAALQILSAANINSNLYFGVLDSTVTATTQAEDDDSTLVATTEYVDRQINAMKTVVTNLVEGGARVTTSQNGGLYRVTSSPVTVLTTFVGANNSTPIFYYIDSTNYPIINGVSPAMRIRCVLAVGSGTQYTGSITIGLYPLTSCSGTTTMSYGTGLAVGGSTVAFTNSALSTIHNDVSSDFPIPANGIYTIGAELSIITPAANYNSQLMVYLQLVYP